MNLDDVNGLLYNLDRLDTYIESSEKLNWPTKSGVSKAGLRLHNGAIQQSTSDKGLVDGANAEKEPNRTNTEIITGAASAVSAPGPTFTKNNAINYRHEQ